MEGHFANKCTRRTKYSKCNSYGHIAKKCTVQDVQVTEMKLKRKRYWGMKFGIPWSLMSVRSWYAQKWGKSAAWCGIYGNSGFWLGRTEMDIEPVCCTTSQPHSCLPATIPSESPTWKFDLTRIKNTWDACNYTNSCLLLRWIGGHDLCRRGPQSADPCFS